MLNLESRIQPFCYARMGTQQLWYMKLQYESERGYPCFSLNQFLIVILKLYLKCNFYDFGCHLSDGSQK